MFCTPIVSVHNNLIDISCADRTYYSYDLIQISLPEKGAFIGKMKYSVKNVSSPSATNSVALLSHVYYSPNYSSPVYTGYEGSIYAEYTSTKIILSFCGVKVKNTTSVHYVSGQVTIDNNF